MHGCWPRGSSFCVPLDDNHGTAVSVRTIFLQASQLIAQVAAQLGCDEPQQLQTRRQLKIACSSSRVRSALTPKASRTSTSQALTCPIRRREDRQHVFFFRTHFLFLFKTRFANRMLQNLSLRNFCLSKGRQRRAPLPGSTCRPPRGSIGQS